VNPNHPFARLQKTGLLCGAFALLLSASGCYRHTRVLEKPLPASVVQTATSDQLIQLVNQQYDAIHSLRATVSIQASVGGASKGQETDYTSVRGFILLRQPERMRVLGLLPVLETRAFDMASNGNHFVLLIPPKSKAYEGADTLTHPSKNSLENLRPFVFLDSLLIRKVEPSELVYVTNTLRLIREDGSKRLMEEPDYDLGILRRMPGTNELEPVRVIHFSRVNLLPFQQDIYDGKGTLVTRAIYSQYRTFGALQFPTEITIERPLDLYKIHLTVEKLAVNVPLEDDQFQLKIPNSYRVQNLDEKKK
jgi:hypothetical protein